VGEFFLEERMFKRVSANKLKKVDKKTANTILHSQVVDLDLNVIVALLENGVPVNAQNKEGDTATHVSLYILDSLDMNQSTNEILLEIL
jgi:ankyrin repeat protein